MTKNTLYDLNNHLFAQIERLGEENLTPDQLAKEIDRTKAITEVSKQIIGNAQLVLDAKVKISDLPKLVEAPPMFLGKG